jgi:CheY-like chemotaxis protein
MNRVLLVHWNAAGAAGRVLQLEAAGYEVAYEPKLGPEFLRELRAKPPVAAVVDLTRLPSHGREVAIAIRHTAATRHVPLVFVEGESEKVERIRRLLPDAIYTTWSKIRSSLGKAIANPPSRPVVPESVLAAYSGTPLPKKLGIKQGMVVALIDAPPRFSHVLSSLPAFPDGVTFRERADDKSQLILWFLTSRRKLERKIIKMTGSAATQPIWLIWPKQASAIASDLTQQVVREIAMAAGLVDYKVCAVDATWSGLLFRRRNG